MSASSAFGSPVVREVNGREVSFRRLTGNDYGVLEEAVKARSRQVERALLDELQIAGKDRLASLRGMEMRPVFTEEVIGFLNTREGLHKALSLASNPATADEAMGSVPFLDLKDLMAEVAGLGVVPADPPVAGETGKATPPSSANDSPASTPAV